MLKIFHNVTENFNNGKNILLNKPEIFLSKIVNEFESMLENYRGDNIDHLERLTNIIINCLIKLEDRQIINHMIDFLTQKYYFFNGEAKGGNFQHSHNNLELISQSILSLINTAALALEKYLPN